MSDDIDAADIAIIGMSGRFPGANTIDEFWNNLRDGVESITFFSEDESLAAGVDPALVHDAHFVRAAARLSDSERFDAAFFDITPREAELMDPQHRLFLECAWSALEHAGYAPKEYPGSIGVYGGATINTYLLFNLASNEHVIKTLDPLQINISNGSDFLTTRVSYKLNLKGPSHVIQSACSTSLVAIHTACQSLLNEENDIALAGGVSINLSQRHGYRYIEGGMASPDGHCRAFDANAQGTIFGSGVGVVVLKRLETALADGDYIHAVIKGSAINNDGSTKVGYTAPSIDGQAKVIAEALTNAGVSAETISYIEAHGTGTPLGDPIEIQALSKAFRATTKRRAFCAIGSVKTNIGHLDAAAGVTGVIKTILALKHQQIPASLHVEQPNPMIDWDDSPFYINTRLAPWIPGRTPRRAGISSFGVGGTNAHLVLEEAPAITMPAPEAGWQLLVLSAKSASALETATAQLASYLHTQRLPLADVAYTLQTGRQLFNHRRFLVCRDMDDALAGLGVDAQRTSTAVDALVDRSTVFMFPGQGAQRLNMALDLYQTQAIVREEIDRCAELLLPQLEVDLRTLLYPPADAAEEESQRLNQTAFAQPALFVVEYALAQQWIAWGVQPQAIIGHSIGEYVAACLAGVFSLGDALALVAARGRLMQNVAPGAMLAVPLPEDEIQAYLGPDLALGAINGPAQCVLSGTLDAIAAVQQQLLDDGINCRRLITSHAFHSAMMEPILEQFTDLVRAKIRRQPTIPFISNVTGTWITPEQATDPHYWAAHLRQPVRFADGISTLLNNSRRALLEVGPGKTLSALVHRHPQCTHDQVVVASLPPQKQPDCVAMLTALGHLWQAGVPLKWEKIHHGRRTQRLPLPTYPFERQHYWIEPGTIPSVQKQPDALATKHANPAQWCYLPSWKRTAAPAPWQTHVPLREQRTWLIFMDDCGVGAALAERLIHSNQQVVLVRAGLYFKQDAATECMINPRVAEDYVALVGMLAAQKQLPHEIVHLWSLSTTNIDLEPLTGFAQAQAAGFYSLIFLTQAFNEHQVADVRQLWVISNKLHNLTGTEGALPEQATLLSPCKVIPQEYPYLICRSIDVVLPADHLDSGDSLVDQLLAEINLMSEDTVIAYRGYHRWAQTFEPAQLPAQTQPSARLREGGVYLMIGGLNSIGFTLSRALAQHVRPKLIFIDAITLPEREVWSHWLATHAEDDLLSSRIRNLQALEALSSEVMVIHADIGNLEHMQACLKRIDETFGTLHGVIYAANVLEEHQQMSRLLCDTAQRDAEAFLTTKIRSLLVIEQVLQGRSLDFCVLGSSLASVLGGIGTVSYTAACLYVDAFVAYQQDASSRRTPWLSINWEAWHFEDDRAHAGLHTAAVDQFAITPQEASAVFLRILGAVERGQVVIAAGDLTLRLNQWIKPKTRDVLTSTDHVAPALSVQPRPELRTPYRPPGNDLERTITQIWQQALGIAPIGIEDNFFDLGGDSLVAIQVSSQLKKALAIDVPTVSLYEGLTVQSLAVLLGADQADQTESGAADGGDEHQLNVSRRKQFHEKQRSRRREDRFEVLDDD